MPAVHFARLTDASPAAILPAVKTLDSAFTADVITRALNGGEPDLAGTPEGIAYWTPHVQHSVLHQEAYTASVAGEVVAVALVKPPGVAMHSAYIHRGLTDGSSAESPHAEDMDVEMMEALRDVGWWR